MPIGAHVRAGGSLIPALEKGAAIGASVVQIFTQSPRAWKPTQYAESVLEGYRAAQADFPQIVATFCHATYLINLASPEPELAERSATCLAANLAVAEGIGSAGLILHVGSHKGAGLAGCTRQIVDSLLDTLSSQPNGRCPILIENAAGTGDTVGRSFEEIAGLLEACGPAGADRLGVCIDTQHLWASGINFASVEEADTVVAHLDRVIGLDRVRALHLNDSKVELGANRDRHENIGQGTIGAAGLGAFISHPALIGLPAILEVPGDGTGTRADDLADARKARQLGLEARRP
jgi:deoxyribonuclease-4